MREIITKYFQKKGNRWVKTTADKVPTRSPSKFFGHTDGHHLLKQVEYTKDGSGRFKTIITSKKMKD
jgi:hypothetical protein